MDASQQWTEQSGRPSARIDAILPTASRSGVEQRRIVELDGLRGLAAIAIVFFHCGPQRLPGGWTAVDLFFVLSGYLITDIILRNAGTPGFLKAFYFRRGLRIWPIYYLTVLAVACVRFVLPSRIRWAGLPYILTYTQFVGRHAFRELPDFCPYLWHTWTLAVEEQFYLVWPLLLLLVGRRRVVPLAGVCVAVAVAGRACGWNWNILGARCDALALGGLLAALLGKTPCERRGLLTASFAALAVLSVATLVALANTVGLNLPSGPPHLPALALLAVNSSWFALIGLIVLHQGHPHLRFLRARPLVYLGRISYGLYLYHFVFLRLWGEIAGAYGWPLVTFWSRTPAVALSFALAALSWKYVEQPILRWRDRVDDRSSSRRPGTHAIPTAGPGRRTLASSSRSASSH